MLLPSEYKALKRVKHGKTISERESSHLLRMGYITRPYFPTDLDEIPPPYVPDTTDEGERAMEDYRVNLRGTRIIASAAVVISVLSLVLSVIELFN